MTRKPTQTMLDLIKAPPLRFGANQRSAVSYIVNGVKYRNGEAVSRVVPAQGQRLPEEHL